MQFLQYSNKLKIVSNIIRHLYYQSNYWFVTLLSIGCIIASSSLFIDNFSPYIILTLAISFFLLGYLIYKKKPIGNLGILCFYFIINSANKEKEFIRLVASDGNINKWIEANYPEWSFISELLKEQYD